MKTKIIMTAALAVGLLFAGCSNDDGNSVSANRTYGMFVGIGIDSYTGTAAPTVTSLSNDVITTVQGINNGLTDFSITGKGSNEEAALADAVRQATAVYNQRAEAVVPQLIGIKTDFEANRALNAAAILDEPSNYHAKITLLFYLVERTGEIQDPIVKQSDSYYMEVIGGQDYTPAN